MMRSSFIVVGTLALLVGCSGDPGTDSGTPGTSIGSGGPSASSGGNGASNAGTGASGSGEGSAGAGGGAGANGGDDAGARANGDAGGGVNGDAGTSADAGGGPSGGAPSIEFAPYFPTWTWGSGGYAYTSLVDLQKKAGVNAVTIAFVLSGGGCKADQGIEQDLSDVKAFVAAGGHVKASFGGADGTYVESQCKDAASLAKAIGDFVDATGITDLDFDVEQDPVMTDAVNALRGDALKQLQDAKHVKVAFTLAANPSPNGGLTDAGRSVVSHAIASGVTISHVNLMTMDYGNSFAGQPLAPVAIGSLTDAHAQLMALMPGISDADAWRRIGVIPMIGKNDDSEVFSLADAKAVAKFATDHQIGLVSFWSIDRDQTCKNGADFNTCSTVDNVDFAFASVFEAVTK